MKENLKVTESGIRRNQSSLKLLGELSIGYDNLPNMYYCNEFLNCRTPEEIVSRAIIVTILAGKGEGLSAEMAQNLIVHFNVVHELTEQERVWLLKKDAEEVEKLKYRWHFEKACVFFSTMGIVKGYFSPKDLCNSGLPGKILKVFPSKKRLLQNSTFISFESILDQADLYYKLNEIRKLHFRSGNFRNIPFNPAAIFERHFAFSWLINFKGLNWDQIEGEIIN